MTTTRARKTGQHAAATNALPTVCLRKTERETERERRFNVSDISRFSVWDIADGDEPEDHVLAGMRHRDFDGVLLWLETDGEPGDPGWHGAERPSDGRPARPLLLFYRGGPPTDAEIAAFLESRGDGLGSDWFPFPDTFDPHDPPFAEGHTPVPLDDRPYPWVEDARLGMRMGRYFSEVELLEWTEPTEDRPGVCRYRFSRSEPASP